MTRFYTVIWMFGLIALQANGMPQLASRHLRPRRSIKHQSLPDPNDCVKQCLSEHASSISDIESRYKLKLILKAQALGIRNPTGNPQFEQVAVDNVHDMFEQMCKRSDITKQCLNDCPKSDLKQLTLIRQVKDRDLVCFPAREAPDFKAYYAAESCTRKIRDKDECDEECSGKTMQVSVATGFQYDDEASPVTVIYETDIKRNEGAARKACKSIKCHIECNKPLIAKQCSENAYEWYVRIKKYEPMATLAGLRYLGALGPNEPSECADFR